MNTSMSALKKYLTQPQARFKKAIEYFKPFYQDFFATLDLEQIASDQISPAISIPLQSGVILVMQMNLKLNPSFNYNPSSVSKRIAYLGIQVRIPYIPSIAHLQKTLSSLPKVNHEYIKLLAPAQINQAYLFNISLSEDLKNHQQNTIIEHYLMPHMQKVNLEKWLWLLDYLSINLES